MKITVSHIPPEGYSFKFTKNAEFFHILADMIRHQEVVFSSPVSGEITAMVLSEEIVEVKGRVAVTLRLECGRCLEAFEQDFERTFILNFISKSARTDLATPDGEEFEISDQDISSEFYSGDVIELQDTIQEQVILALPQKPLCSESCKGLCVSCGANLNNEPCACPPSQGHPAFAALKGLKP